MTGRGRHRRSGPGPFRGVRVIELGDAAAAYCGKLLADLGADVLKVEAPPGDPARAIPPLWPAGPAGACGIAFRYQNAGKRSITLNVRQPPGRKLAQDLAASADVLVETFRPGEPADLGLDYATLSAAHPSLVATSITGFGQTGPRSGLRWSDAVAFAMSGLMSWTGPPDKPPLLLPGALIAHICGLHAAAATAMALWDRDHTGFGRHIDISMQEALTSFSSLTGVAKFLEDHIKEKRGPTSRATGSPSGLYPCKDGQVALTVGRPHMWAPLARWIAEVSGHQEVLDPIFNDRYQRLLNANLVDQWVAELTSRYSMDEAFREGQSRGVVVAPLNTCATLLENRQLVERRFFIAVGSGVGALAYPGAPYRLSLTPWKVAGRVAAPGEHNHEVTQELRRAARRAVRSTPGPLSRDGADGGMPGLRSLRVLEISVGGAVPWLCKHLGWHGAEIIRIEMRSHPDALRTFISPREPEKGMQPNRSPWQPEWHSGKLHTGINLEDPAGQDLFDGLVSISDAVLTNLGPGAAARLGLTYPRLRRVNPGIILLHNTAFGATGPYARYKAWGMQIEAIAGLTHLSRYPGASPLLMPFVLPDWMASLYGIIALMGALRERARTGRGQSIDLSMLELAVASMGDLVLEYTALGREPQPRGNDHPSVAPHGCYPCQGEDRWCVMAAFSDDQWARMRSAMGEPAWAQDPRFQTAESRVRHRRALDQWIAQWSSQRAPYEVMATMQGAGVPAGVVQEVEDLLQDEHLRARGYFVTYSHRFKGQVLGGGLAIRLREPDGKALRAGQAVGEDNEDVFRGLLGLDREAFLRLDGDKVIERDGSVELERRSLTAA